MWKLALFEGEELSVIPVNWIKDGKSYWPPYRTDSRIEKAKSNREIPNADWQFYKIFKFFGHDYDCFAKATRALKMCQDTSDLSSAEDSRKIVIPKRFRNIETSSDEDEVPKSKKLNKMNINIPKPVLPKPPQIVQPTMKSTTNIEAISTFSEQELASATSELESEDLEEQNRQSTSRQIIGNEKILLQKSVRLTSGICQPTEILDTEFKAMVLSTLASMAQELKKLSSIIYKEHLVNYSIPKPKTTEELMSLPAKTVEELDGLEIGLKKEDVRESMLAILKFCGGNDPSNALQRMEKKILIEDVAAKFNFTGVKGKLKFKMYTNLCSTMLDALRSSFPHAKLSDLAFDKLMGHWLTNVGERVRKRTQRSPDDPLNLE